MLASLLFSYSLCLPATITSAVGHCGPQTHLVGLIGSATWNSLANLGSFHISLRLAPTAKTQLSDDKGFGVTRRHQSLCKATPESKDSDSLEISVQRYQRSKANPLVTVTYAMDLVTSH